MESLFFFFFWFLLLLVVFLFSIVVVTVGNHNQMTVFFFFKGRMGTSLFFTFPPPLLSDMLVLMPTSGALVAKCFFSVFPLIPLSIVGGSFFFFCFSTFFFPFKREVKSAF